MYGSKLVIFLTGLGVKEDALLLLRSCPVAFNNSLCFPGLVSSMSRVRERTHFMSQCANGLILNGLILNAESMKALQELLLALINVGSESSISRSDFVLHVIKCSVQEAQPS